MNAKLKNAYLLLQKNCGIRKGDLVKINRKATTYENGWGCSWEVDMDKCVGTSGIVTDINDIGIEVDFGSKRAESYYFPFFVLEKLEIPVKEMSEEEFNTLCVKEFGYRIRIK